MKKTKILSLALCLALVLSGFSLTAMALSFDDVDNDPTVSWAKESITKMTDAGYIKGYEDGTFRPYRAITKIECLILMSRMLGLEDEEFKATADAAYETYKGVVSKYNSTYTKELCYLLYTGILKEGDLADYASAANANTQLLRYQAAILMSKLMGSDTEAKAFTVSAPTYADNSTIPTNARPYVEFVTKNNIMNGMDATESGEPQFSPITSLTRAQMATLLARMMDKLDVTQANGVVEDVDASTITVDGDEYDLSSSAKVYVDGEAATTDDIAEGDEVSALCICNKVILIETSEPLEVVSVYGLVVNKSENSSGKKITIADYEDKDTNATYTLSNECVIYKGSSKSSFSNIMADDFVKLEITGSKVTKISTEDTKIDIEGKLVSVDYDNEDHVYLNVSDKDGENVQTYTVSIKGIKVSRDGLDAELRDLSAGDTVEMRLTYGKVTKVIAKSTSETFSGLLTEIILSSTPSITVTKDGVSKNYKLRSDVKITIAGVTSDIYDLRPNITITGKLNSSEVQSISASTIAVSESGEMSGTVTGKNTSYNVITIEDEDGNAQSIYFNSKTTFLNSSGNSTTVKSLENGSKISVTGAYKNGVFEATIIIIK